MRKSWNANERVNLELIDRFNILGSKIINKIQPWVNGFAIVGMSVDFRLIPLLLNVHITLGIHHISNLEPLYSFHQEEKTCSFKKIQISGGSLFYSIFPTPFIEDVLSLREREQSLSQSSRCMATFFYEDTENTKVT